MFREERAFPYALTSLIGEGGDVDTNAAVAGALVGARFGFSGLPESWKLLRDQPVMLDLIKCAGSRPACNKFVNNFNK